MMKISRFFLILLCGAVLATGANAYTNRNTAVIQVMNKAAGKVHTVAVPVGQSINFEKLNITVRACLQSDPFEAENFYAFTEITKSGERFFSNWLNRNNPGKNPVQNPDYDAWLVKCE